MKNPVFFLIFTLLISCSKNLDKKELNKENQNFEQWDEYMGDKARTH